MGSNDQDDKSRYKEALFPCLPYDALTRVLRKIIGLITTPPAGGLVTSVGATRRVALYFRRSDLLYPSTARPFDTRSSVALLRTGF